MLYSDPLDTTLDIISVWIVDDHADYRESIVEMLDDEPGMVCSQSFPTCEALFVALRTMPAPHVVLMDIVIPDHMTGIQGVEKLREIVPDTYTIMLTNYSDSDKIFDAICAGARGYLLKFAEEEKIIEAITEARNGGTFMNPQIARRVITMFTDYTTPSNEYNLTDRELEVLRLLVDGLKKREIAEELFVEFCTIDTHMRNIYAKLHVHSRTEAVVKALKERLI